VAGAQSTPNIVMPNWSDWCFTADTADDEKITWKHVMFHSWKRLNTEWLVTCDSVEQQRDTEKLTLLG
jgi:hypothetical protein